MHRRPRLSLVSLLIIGLWGVACGDDPQPPANKTPVVTGPTVASADMTSGTAVALTLEATDADGDTLTYAWVQAPATPEGTFSDPASASPTWTAPTVTTATSFLLGVTVSDGREGTVRRSVTVLVRPAPPANKSPVIATGTPSASSTSVTGAVAVQLSVSASDADEDPLTYSWTQTPATPVGSFTSFSASNPTWTSPVVTAATRFTLKVTVSDGKGGTAQGQVDVDVAPPVTQNNPPTVGTPTANPTTLDWQQSTNLSVSASDPDNDTLTYAWTQSPASPAGTFSSTTSATPTWAAPQVTTDTPFQLRVAVSDSKGGSGNGTVTVTVNAHPNNAPALTAGPTASATTINEQTSITLSVSATDADGDPLTYSWAQSPASPAGSFSSTTSASPTWTAPDVTATGTYTLRVTVSDDQGGSVQGTVDISVQKVNQPPNVGASISGPTTLIAGASGTFSITANDPDGDALTYTWTQTSPATLGTFVGSTANSSAQWYSPVLNAQTSFSFSVSVTDEQSTPVVRTVTVPVTVPHYTDVQNIWNTVPCTGCHGTSGSLSLAVGSSHGNLVNVTSTICGPISRVTPGDPGNSALVRKMEGTTCGTTRMPRNDQTYFDRNPGLIILVRSWILAGAAND